MRPIKHDLSKKVTEMTVPYVCATHSIDVSDNLSGDLYVGVPRKYTGTKTSGKSSQMEENSSQVADFCEI